MAKPKEIIKKKKKSPVVEMDEKTINEAVQFINEKANETIYRGSLEIGEYVLRVFFNDDIAMASSKNPKKQGSFNKLCKRKDLIVNPNRLAIMVRVASQERYLSINRVSTEGLTYTHKAALVRLENNPTKIDLLNKCLKSKWSTRALEAEVYKKLKLQAPDQSPSFMITTKKLISRLDSSLKNVDSTDLHFDLDDLRKMNLEERNNLQGYLNQLKTKAEDGKKEYENLLNKCECIITDIEKIGSEPTSAEKEETKPENENLQPGDTPHAPVE